MSRLAASLLAAAVFALPPAARADDAMTTSSDARVNAKIDAIVSHTADSVVRAYGRPASFCAANHEPPLRSAEDSLKAFVAAVSTGTREGLVEIARTDADFRDSPVPDADTVDAMVDQQSNAIMKMLQANPAAGCQRFFAMIDASADAAEIKAATLQDRRDYLASRAPSCAGTPKPADCK